LGGADEHAPEGEGKQVVPPVHVSRLEAARLEALSVVRSSFAALFREEETEK